MKTGEAQGVTRSRIFRKEESQKLFVDLSGNVLEGSLKKDILFMMYCFELKCSPVSFEKTFEKQLLDAGRRQRYKKFGNALD